MVFRSFGALVTTFFILYLFIQGIYGEGLLEDVLDEENSEETVNLSSKERYSELTEALWEERVKKPWFRTTVKNPPFLESDIHHDNWRVDSLSLIDLSGKKDFGDTWLDRMKLVIAYIIGSGPAKRDVRDDKFVQLLKLFWPTAKKTIWKLIKDVGKGVLDQKIINYVLDVKAFDIKHLYDTIQKFLKATKREDRAQWMTFLIDAGDDMFKKLQNHDLSPHTIPIVITHSIPHLLLLRARVRHGKDIYDEDHTPEWTRALEYTIDSYKVVLRQMFLKWLRWRYSKITVDVGSYTKHIDVSPFFTTVTYGTVVDGITGDASRYIYTGVVGPNNDKYFKSLCKAVKKNIFALRKAELLKIMLPAFFLDNFMPGNEDNVSVVPASMSEVRFGPISPHIGGGDQNCHLYKPDDDNTRGGDVTQINVREWNIINGIQVSYSTHNGTFIGDWEGGKFHEFPLNGRRIKSIQVCKNYCNIAEMTIGFSDGKSTGRLGNRRQTKVRCVTVGGIDTYGLYNIRGTGVGCVKGLFQLGLDFKAYPIRPFEILSQAPHSMDLALRRIQDTSPIDEKKKQCRSRRLRKGKKESKGY